MVNNVHEAFAALTVDADPKSKTLTLTSGSDRLNQHIHKVQVYPTLSGGAQITQLKIQFYDGDPAGAGTAIGNAAWLATQPIDGFVIDRRVSTGILGMKITGYVSGTVVIYATAFYNFTG